MSSGKKPLIRYQIIDECLKSRTKHYWSMEELLEKIRRKDLSVSIRTLKADIQSMRFDSQLGHYAPIRFCRRNMGYCYTVEGYSISQFSLNEYDICFLKMATALLLKFRDSPLHLLLQESFRKFSKMLETTSYGKGEAQSHILFEPVHYLKGLDHWIPIKMAILLEYPLTVILEESTRPKQSYIFHPYFLKESKSRWHVLGYHQEKNDAISLSLDRIKELSQASVPYIPNTFVYPDQWFKYTIGITKGNSKPQQIILSFTPAIAHFVKSQHIHETQKVITDDDRQYIIELTLVLNYELKSMILGWGENVEVIAPTQLRNEITEVIKVIFKKYH